MSEKTRVAKVAEDVAVRAEERPDPIETIVREAEQKIAERAREIEARSESRAREHTLSDWKEAARDVFWQPAIELLETDGELVLEVAVPGVARDDLDVRVDRERAVVRAQAVRHRHHEGEKVHRCEYRCGALFRDVELPVPVDPGGATAELEEGILRVTMPRAGGATGAA